MTSKFDLMNPSYLYDNPEVARNTLDLPVHLPNCEPPIANEEKQVVPSVDSTSVASVPTAIQGTSIVLESDEDIAKWIAERRKRWPTKKNIELKQSIAAQSIKRPAEADVLDPSKKRKIICRFFKQHGKCKFGAKCRNSHEQGTTSSNDHQQKPPEKSSIPKETLALSKLNETHFTRRINGLAVLIPKLFTQRAGGDASKNSHNSLFASLVKKDQFEHENSLVLDFIRYLDSTDRIDHDVFQEKPPQH